MINSGCETSHKKRLTYLKITTFWALMLCILVEDTKISD